MLTFHGGTTLVLPLHYAVIGYVHTTIMKIVNVNI
jgi:hypothetical protein